MSYLEYLTSRLELLQLEYDLDVIDLKILKELTSTWEDGRKPRVTDITLGSKIASPATLQNRINKTLVDAGLITLQTNPDDAREKLIEKGPRYEKFEEFLLRMYLKG